ncbi:hypothetical protein [Streptomyces genisteinicus]|uniref:Uncharacterized protein n=1 Tax=Streptomyces genisteinicus TaxID=2768068 RepID=A0A7H0I552_9ACTN|nr:hypothetical protein [Streptomyces genisteinicus]QNP67918.1 hypothetical protein IAG43_33805 [Streptomyces genisteinicus]
MRDLVTIALCAALVALVAVIVTMAFNGSALASCKAGGTAFIAVATVGLVALQHLKRHAE